MMNYSQEQLQSLLGSVGEDVRIHSSVVFFNPKKIFLGSHVRIDCFSLLSAGEEGIHFHNHIHIGAGSYLFGGGGKIELDSFANISSRVSLFTSNDDYVDGYMTNPMVPHCYKKVENGPIALRKHAIIGSGAIILPNVEIGLGGVVGALSLVKNTVEPFTVVCGIPAKKKEKERNRKFLELEMEFEKEFHS
jgi:galactoside O-acetyltransferase